MSGTYFLWRQGPQESGIRFLLRITLNSGECVPALEEVVDGGVGVMLKSSLKWKRFASRVEVVEMFQMDLAAGAR